MVCREALEEEVAPSRPDLKFRGFERVSDSEVRVVWFVVTREDVAGFKATVFKSTGETATEITVPYNTRQTVIGNLDGSEIYRLCFTALDSQGAERNSFSSQCDRFGPLRKNASNGSTPSIIVIILGLLSTLAMSICCRE